jgi:hypothetical protein
MRLCRTLLLLLACAVLPATPATADGPERTGEQIYRGTCQKCHGAGGVGVKGEYDDPLTGNRSVPQLAKYVERAMPPDDPYSLTEAEATKVAGYIHGAFYSKEAQERNAPPRVALARLTVNQYRQTLYDLVGAPTWAANRGEHGLKGEYFDGRRYDKTKRLTERVDPTLDFDFGTAGPTEKSDGTAFYVLWSGSVVAPETGGYEFIVNCDQAFKLWVNDQKTPLIDAWVKSGTDAEFRATADLVGGRAYPVKLEFSKAKQGVNDDPNKKKPRPVKPAMVRLSWRRPGHAVEVVPTRFLLPTPSPEGYAAATAFPADDRSYGWERGTTVSKEWDQAVTDAALEAVAHALPRVDRWANTKPDAPDRAAKLKAFAVTFAEAAFRRPLTDAEKKVYVEQHFADFPENADAALKRSLLLTLVSPRFLYRETPGTPSQYATASRLSYALWDSLPDKELLKAAAKGELGTPEQVRRQAERMARDPRAAAKLTGLLNHWLGLDRAHELSKKPDRFPGFDTQLAEDLRTSLDLTFADILESDGADFRRLLTEDKVFLNDRLAKFYGVTPPKKGFEKVALDPGKRMGTLTHPFVLANYAYTSESSPIHRGVFLVRGVLGLTLKPPTEAFTPFDAELHPSLTTRERTDLQTSTRACQQCHGVINPLGFSLEAFDAVGRFRATERGKPIDALGSYLDRAGRLVKLDGAVGLSKYLAGSTEVHDSFVQQAFHHLAQQPVRAYGPRTQDELREAFVKSGFNIRQLAVEIAVVAASPPAETTANVQKSPPK